MSDRQYPCAVCGSKTSAAIFASEDWCCDDHRKIVQGWSMGAAGEGGPGGAWDDMDAEQQRVARETGLMGSLTPEEALSVPESDPEPPPGVNWPVTLLMNLGTAVRDLKECRVTLAGLNPEQDFAAMDADILNMERIVRQASVVFEQDQEHGLGTGHGHGHQEGT